MGPTCEVNANGNKEWYLNGKYHRTDGPAIERVNGDKAWYLNSEYITDNPLIWMVMQYENN